MTRFCRIAIPVIVTFSMILGCKTPGNQSSLEVGGDESPELANIQKTDVIVQLFNWPFQKITSEMKILSDIGYAQIHVSPPNVTVDTDIWYGRYQPVDYRQISGPLGNEAEFKAMIAEAHKYGIKIIVDLVLNHTANPTFPLPKEAKDLIAEKGPLFTEADYNPPNCINDYNDALQVRNRRLCGPPGDQGLPDLNQNSPNVLKVQKEFIQRLNAYGVDAYRFDAVKHMEPDYFARLLTPDILGDRFIFGEIIADKNSYDRDLGPYLGYERMSFYDFPLRDTVQKAFELNGSLASLVDADLVSSRRALPYNRAVTFVMNHDIPNNAGFRYMILNESDEMLAYAFLLGRSEGIPYVYSDLGTKGGAGLIDDRWDHAHRNPLIGRMVKFHNFVHGESSKVIYVDACMIAIQRGGKGVVGINKCQDTRSFNLQDNFRLGTRFRNLDDNSTFIVNRESPNVSVSPRSAVVLIAQ